ncbi:hypothetical protein, partial [Plasmodium yoelii yoelii]
MYNLLIECIL